MTRPTLAVALWACLAGCATAPEAPATALAALGAASTDEPTMEPRVRPHLIDTSLENGLRILLVQDRTAPLVTYQVWFNVGSIYENEAPEGTDHGITGLSHFFEHLMFRGTKKYPRYFDRIYAMGGKLNAFTWLDETVYWENLPS